MKYKLRIQTAFSEKDALIQLIPCVVVCVKGQLVKKTLAFLQMCETRVDIG